MVSYGVVQYAIVWYSAAWQVWLWRCFSPSGLFYSYNCNDTAL